MKIFFKHPFEVEPRCPLCRRHALPGIASFERRLLAVDCRDCGIRVFPYTRLADQSWGEDHNWDQADPIRA